MDLNKIWNKFKNDKNFKEFILQWLHHNYCYSDGSIFYYTKIDEFKKGIFKNSILYKVIVTAILSYTTSEKKLKTLFLKGIITAKEYEHIFYCFAMRVPLENKYIELLTKHKKL